MDRQQPEWLEKATGRLAWWLAALIVVSLMIAHECRRADGGELRVVNHQAVVTIYQSKHRTTGAIVQATDRGTFILTCKHSRTKGDSWAAAGLKGKHTAVSNRTDLALLWTRDRWAGPVLTIAAEGPDLPIRFMHHETLPKPLPCGYPLYSVDYPAKPGDSGGPLLHRGQLCGVRWGHLDHDPNESLYIQHSAIVRFLKEVTW